MTGDLSKFEEYLETARIPLRLACKTESGWPMALSLWFQYQDGKLYCATQKSARVVAYLKNEPRCAFEIAADQPPYCGVRGQAVASMDESIGVEILEKLLKRYLGDTDNLLSHTLLAKSDQEVAIILEPVNIFRWDFSTRMQEIDFPETIVTKVCP
ncbi:MAG: pyridoxamine 5'-phosphate oxidase family protein [Anaerolineales bacterium]|nr:pyridoxamine 5'-phosphate oxidase family protein [Anaerolineales bacterium]